MNLDKLRSFCRELPAVTEGVKWQNDLCFMVAGKFFCIAGFESPLMVSLKVGEEEFEELSSSQGIIPAPYLARYKWILVKEPNSFSQKQWEHYIRQSYELVKAKLSKKILQEQFKGSKW